MNQPNINAKSLRGIIERVVASELRIDIEYLRRRWAGQYDPCVHLFDRNTGEPVWACTVDVWDMIGKAYCRWMCLTDQERFWYDVYATLLNTRSWWAAEPKFHLWFMAKWNSEARQMVQGGALNNLDGAKYQQDPRGPKHKNKTRH